MAAGSGCFLFFLALGGSSCVSSPAGGLDADFAWAVSSMIFWLSEAADSTPWASVPDKGPFQVGPGSLERSRPKWWWP